MTTEKPSIAELRRTRDVMNDRLPWRQGAVEKYNVFVHDIESLGGTAGERVLLKANTHFPYAENLAAVVALVNAAPALLEIAAAALAMQEARQEYLTDQSVSCSRVGEAHAALAVALAKVRP